MATRIHYSADRNPHDPYASARKQAVTWACGTLASLGIEVEREGSAWLVCAFWGWEGATTASELSKIARGCLDFAREMDRLEGPVQS